MTTDPLAVTIRQLLEGKAETSIHEIASALGFPAPSRDLQTRISMTLKQSGFMRFEIRSGSCRFVYRRPATPAAS